MSENITPTEEVASSDAIILENTDIEQADEKHPVSLKKIKDSNDAQAFADDWKRKCTYTMLRVVLFSFADMLSDTVYLGLSWEDGFASPISETLHF